MEEEVFLGGGRELLLLGKGGRELGKGGEEDTSPFPALSHLRIVRKKG